MSSSITSANFSGNETYGYAGLTAGTTTTYTTANAFPFSIDGVMYSKAAVTNGASPTTDLLTGAAFKPLAVDTVNGNACVFVFAVNTAGTVSVAQGPIVKNSQLDVNPLVFPQLPDTVAAFGYLVARAGTTLAAPWTFGSSNLSGVTGMTYTFRNVNKLPARPIQG